ncbi:MAG: hypothetical protein CME19_02470 [Gemmatimonadetes bacterium]|nr:hypothetical protein [Gemmatimonadota bacterium]
MRRHELLPEPPETRVPLIISWPDRFKAGVNADGLVELTDLAPTLCDIAGIDPGWTHGQSLLPILTGNVDPDHHHDYVRCAFYDVLDTNVNAGRPSPPPSYGTMYRTDRHKFCVYHGNPYGEIYDLRVDPDKHDNLWEDAGSQSLKSDLLKASFDDSITIHDPGSTRIGRF